MTSLLVLLLGLQAQEPARRPEPAPPQGLELVAGDWRLRFYGFVRGDAIYDDSRPNNTQTIIFIRSEDPSAPATFGAEEDSEDFTMHARLTRLGFDVSGPPVELLGGAGSSAKIEFDFYNNALQGQSESRAAIRMRHAYLKLSWEDLFLLAGQTTDIIAPIFPVVNADMVMWGAGNPGDRRPMFLADWHPSLGPGELVLQGELGLPGADDNQDADANGTRDGEASGLPTLQGRAAWRMPHPWLDRARVEAGVWGHRAWEHLDAPPPGVEEDYDSEAVGFDLALPLLSRLQLRGEVWRGRNVDDIRAGIFQGINTATGEEIDSRGYWAEVAIGTTDWHTLHLGRSRDNPEDDDVPPPSAAAGRADNLIHYVANRLDLGSGLTVGLDYMRWRTRWKGGFDDGTDNRFQFFVMWAF